ncbi:MAG: hypothetical protein HOQ22_05320, partial [Nocardioidaceae bacterium]|nr:hypothetical protein [Nocardioidaceae bacterium]
LGSTLRVVTGSVTPRGTASVQWIRSGVRIPGATGTTYRLRSADLGKVVKARVTWTRTGYTTLNTYTAPSTRLRTTPVLRATLTPGHGRVTASVRVTAPGLRPVPGVVTFRSGGELLKAVTLRNGVATATVRLEPGLRWLHFRYGGDIRVYRGALDRSVRVR